MGALKITAILLNDSHDEADVVSIVRLALLNAGCNVDSVDAVGIPQDAILYREIPSGREYVHAIPASAIARNVIWTYDIDRAKVCHGPASLADCIREVKERNGLDAQVMYI